MRNLLAVLAAAVVVSACAAVPVGTIVGPDYVVHVDPEAARKCNEAWRLFPTKAPLGTLGCAIWRQGFAGDAQLGEIFLPAHLNCVAYAPPVQWMVQHEVRRCEGWHD